MLPVLVFFFSFLFVNGIANLYGDKKRSSAFQTFSCLIILIVFFACRDLPILNDTSHYYGYMWKTINIYGYHDYSIWDNVYKTKFEYGFLIWSRIIAKYISNDAYSLIFITAIIQSIFIVYFVRIYNREKIALTIFFLTSFCLMFYAAMRQGYAMMFFLIGYRMLEKGKNILWYFVCVGIAFMFHQSAILTIFFPILLRVRALKRAIIVTVFCALLMAVFIYPLLEEAGMDESIYYRTNLKRSTFPLAAVLNVLLNLFFILLSIWLWKTYKVKNAPRGLVWSWVITLCYGIISVPFLIFGRVVAYWQIFIPIGLVYMYIKAKENISCNLSGRVVSYSHKKMSPEMILMIAFVVYVAQFMVILLMKNEWYHLVPYSFYDFKPGLHNFHFGY